MATRYNGTAKSKQKGVSGSQTQGAGKVTCVHKGSMPHTMGKKGPMSGGSSGM